MPRAPGPKVPNASLGIPLHASATRLARRSMQQGKPLRRTSHVAWIEAHKALSEYPSVKPCGLYCAIKPNQALAWNLDGAESP